MKKRKAIFVLLSVFLIVKLLFLTRFHSIIWDEGVYLAMAKFIYSLGDSGFWEIVRPIALPLVLGVPWKLGLDQIVFGEVIAVLFSCGFIYMTYLIAAQIFDRRAAIMAALLAAITPIFFLYSSYILTGMPASFFMLVALYLYIRRKIVLCGVFSGISFLFRFPLGLFLVIVLASLALEHIKKGKLKDYLRLASRYLLAFFLTVLPFLLSNYFLYEKETSRWWHAAFRPFIMGSWAQFNTAESIATDTAIGQLHNIFYYPLVLFASNILLLFSIAGIIFYIRAKFHKKRKGIIIPVSLVVFLSYFTYITNKQPRFSLPFLAFFCIFAGYGIALSAAAMGEKNIKKTSFYTLILVIMVLIINIDLSYYLWRPSEKPAMIDELYGYFDGKNLGGKVMTTEPLMAVYSDQSFLPVFSADVASRKYELNKDDINAVVFSPSSFYCPEGSKGCSSKADLFQVQIREENSLALNRTYGGRQYFIYLKGQT